MSNLKSLKDRSTLERIKLLQAGSALFLPSPTVESESVGGENQQSVNDLLSEIRKRLNIRHNDLSIKEQTRIMGLLSEELSEAIFEGVNLTSVGSRLGEKGILHPSQYEIVFGMHIDVLEALGTRRNHLAEAVQRPDNFINIESKHSRDTSPRLTLSVRYVETRHVEDRFVLLVVSARTGLNQRVMSGYRVYFDEVDLRHGNEPLEVLRLFTERYGVPFRILDSRPAKLLIAETVAISTTFDNLVTHDLTAVGVKEKVLWPCFIGDKTNLSSPDGGVLADLLLGFLLNLSSYIETLRRHRVDVPDDLLTRFKEPLFPIYST